MARSSSTTLVVLCLPLLQVVVLSAAADQALLEAAKMPAAGATGAASIANTGAGSSGIGEGDVVVQLQRPSMFTFSKVCAVGVHMHVHAVLTAGQRLVVCWWPGAVITYLFSWDVKAPASNAG